ncbi:MAG: 2,3-bisphosphoglycerate-independent phosphoglycerate mutase [Desulfobacterales bacterium]|nr:2,3-bisphosphoglycerate-independent phosphoglycerate mutase [Desulfobacterales bacterium]
MIRKKPCMLMILDGWGIGPENPGNAVLRAPMPYLKRLKKKYPGTHLLCAGKAVGLPAGIMGNSEVGHLNIGAGRIVLQDLLSIDTAIKEGAFFENRALTSVLSKVKANRAALHLLGLVSDGGVHSHLNHLFALLKMAQDSDLERVFIHAILDGRDTSPDSGKVFLSRLQEFIHKNSFGVVATVCGRYYAMDRDNRWDRIEKAYRLYSAGKGRKETDPIEAVTAAYGRAETDEFVLPIVITDDAGRPAGTLQDGDGVIFFNFRSDRARQITHALTDPLFDHFSRQSRPNLCEFVCMTSYDEKLELPVAFPPMHLNEILGEVISRHQLKQLRIAETEKYAHVTYFFNGGEETPFPLEERCLIDSPKEVATYDRKPEMSAPEVTREVISRIKTNSYDLIVLNFANLDMVGHSGNLAATIKACGVVDGCVRKIVSAVKSRGGIVLITADHGNAEEMLDEGGRIHTAHTLNPVPFILVDDDRQNANLRPGILADIAPTILDLMGIEKPRAMTGTSLLGGVSSPESFKLIT